jgi:hypothetical protein
MEEPSLVSMPSRPKRQRLSMFGGKITRRCVRLNETSVCTTLNRGPVRSSTRICLLLHASIHCRLLGYLHFVQSKFCKQEYEYKIGLETRDYNTV